MRRKSLPIIIIILTGVVATVGSIVINVASNMLPAEIMRHPGLVWAALAILTLTGVGLAIWQYRLQKADESLPTSLERLNRRLMLDKMQRTRVDSVLGKPLPGAVPIILHLREQSDLVSNTSRPRFHQPDTSALIPSTDILPLYENAGSTLLILGNSGSGKTTLLLQLARELIKQARQDETMPIPVVFNLSSWSMMQQSLAHWLTEELQTSYHVEPPLAQSWVEQNQLLLLLDGLDRVPAQHLETCVRAINAYHRRHGLVPIVICCRRDEYTKLNRKLDLEKAVMIEPLTSEEIDEYLAQRGEHLLPLRTAIKSDPDLLKLATTPLMLTLLPLVYQNQQDIRALTSESPTTWQDQILAHFLERMLQDPGMKTSYTDEKTKRWLSWLAWQLTQRQQTELFLERMQPDWLPTDLLRQQYYGAVQLIVGMLVGGLVYGMISSYKFGLLTAVRTGLEWVILSGVCLAFFNKRETEAQPLPTSFRLLWQRLYKKFAQRSVLVLAGIILIFGLLGIVVKSGLGLVSGIDVSPLALALSGVALNLLLIGLLSTLLDAINPHIQPVEYVRWSWKALTQNVRKAIPIGCCFGVLIIFEIVATLLPGHGLDVALATALGGGLVIAFIGGAIVTIISGLASGLPSGKLDERAFVIPNQGIRRSAKNSVLVGVLTGLSIALMSELIIALSLWPSFGWLQGLRTAAIYAALIGLLGGIALGLLRGGIACIQHFVLRAFLRVENYAPFNYPHFLHYAAGCNLLYRVGGGYMFFHPLLQDYLALETSHYFPKLDTALPTARLMERDGHKASPLVSKKGGSSGRRGSVRASAKRARNK